LQEEFESLQDAVSGALGDAQHNNHDVQHLTSMFPTSIASSKISVLAPCANNTFNDASGLAEVHSGFQSHNSSVAFAKVLPCI
jgi:hypothetical protein